MRIKLEQDETAKLIERSDRDHLVKLSFGPGGVWLDSTKCPWASELVLKWRASGRVSDPEGF